MIKILKWGYLIMFLILIIVFLGIPLLIITFKFDKTNGLLEDLILRFNNYLFE